MGKTKIEWTEYVWNPITGCSVHSPGCTNCYAMKLAGTRMKHHWSRKGLTVDTKAGPVWTGDVRFNEEWLTQPLRWKRPRMIFVCAHADLFHEKVPDEWIDRIFAVMALCPQHTFQVLTKRADRMRSYLADSNMHFRVAMTDVNMRLQGHSVETMYRALPLRNVWLGVSVEDQKRANERIPDLLATPAAVRWLSCEPLLGPIKIDLLPDYRHARDCAYVTTDGPAGCTCSAASGGIDWVVAGGESGPGARPMHPDWARSLRDQCTAAGVPFLFKQWGEWTPKGSVDIYCHGPERNQRAHPNSEGLSMLRDGRVCMRDFTVTEHARRIAAREAYSSRAVEIDTNALADFHAECEADGPVNPLGYQWFYRVGKKAAGRLLDGVEHNGFPA